MLNLCRRGWPLNCNNFVQYIPKFRFSQSEASGTTKPQVGNSQFQNKIVPKTEELSALPKLLLANTRSALPKLKTIEKILLEQNIDCFVATETWFSNKHSDVATSIKGFNCYRDDRSNRTGGGVAIYVSDSISSERMNLDNKPRMIETVGIVLQPKLLIIGCYFPPIAATAMAKSITGFLVNAINQHQDHDAILCGDLNKFQTSEVCAQCNLKNMFTGATYGEAQLDYILMSEELSNVYRSSCGAPIDNSKTAHLSLLTIPEIRSLANQGFEGA